MTLYYKSKMVEQVGKNIVYIRVYIVTTFNDYDRKILSECPITPLDLCEWCFILSGYTTLPKQKGRCEPPLYRYD